MAEDVSPKAENSIPGSFDPEMSEIHESFLVESNEILESMGRDLLELEKSPSDTTILHRIFRAAHTLKGTSAFLGLKQMTEFAHALEELLNKLRKGELIATSEVIDVFFEAYDALKELVARVEKNVQEPMDLAITLAKIDDLTHGRGGSEKDPLSPSNASSLDDHHKNEFANQQRLVDTTVRVDVNRLDELLNLVGELVLARNRLSQSAHFLGEDSQLAAEAHDIHEASQQIDSITSELQMAVMKTRMVPVAKVFNKLPRLVRDLARETQKEIDLQIYGKETELDKSIMEELNDPLIHIIRNAIDHGIESPDDRVAARKPKKGTIVVNAEHEGNHIVISVEDDGRGMNAEVLKSKAIEKKIITKEQAAEMSDREAFNLVFTPGFTTAEIVTNISGRGVGMDIVRSNVAKLKGLIEIDSQVGRGTVLTLKLPLTLAIIQGLLVESSGDIFAIPLSAVVEVVRVRPAEFGTLGTRKVMRLRDSVLAVGSMSDILGLSEMRQPSEWSYVVVVSWSEKKLGIVVDAFLGQKEIVIKSIGDLMGDIPAIGGSTILGDGKVVLILDVGQFVSIYEGMDSRAKSSELAQEVYA